MQSVLQQPSRENNDTSYKFIKTSKHIHKVMIKKESWGYSINIGGKDYEKCIHINISTDMQDKVKKAKISHIQSEKECSFDKVLENKDTIQFLQAGLTFCKIRFPDIQRFEFDDMSNIECGVSLSEFPPRQYAQPFALPQFSIAKYGMTWYEQKFGAKMLDDKKYKKYREQVESLKQPITIPFEEFVDDNFLNSAQKQQIEPYYKKATSWNNLFQSIPKDKQCEILHNWLYSFVDRTIEYSFQNYGWYIDATTMQSEPIEILESYQTGGKKNIWKKTLRRKRIGAQMRHY